MKHNRKERTPLRHTPHYIACLLVVVLVYLVIGAIAPFVNQPEINKTFQSTFTPKDFYSKLPGKERAAVISDNDEALLLRLQLISQARERIILSSYDFKTDESGLMILSALYEAAQCGVKVCVIVDGLNAVTKVQYNPYFQALSAHENGEVRIYNPFKPWFPWRSMGRMHDKYLIADNFAYLLGGRNTHDGFLKTNSAAMCYDWDILVYTEQENGDSSLNALSTYFTQIWESDYTGALPSDTLLNNRKRVQKAIQTLCDLYTQLYIQHPEYFEVPDYAALTVPVNRISLLQNPTHIYAKEPTVFYALTELMQNAHQEVFIHTPYITCNPWMLDRFSGICASGIPVTLMTNSVANNANPLGSMDYYANRDKILATGMQILEYDGGTSYHGKCISIDGRLSIIGSFNMDMRSTYIDTELMLVIDSIQLNQSLREKMKHYEADSLTLRQSLSGDVESVIPAGLQPQTIAFGRRVAEFLLHPFLKLIRFLI